MNKYQEELSAEIEQEESIQYDEDIREEIRDYIDYYNNDRYQWNLKKMTPVQYRNHLFASIA